MRKISKKAVLLGATIGVMIGLTVTAVAYWTQSGGGNGSVTTGSTTAVVVNQASVDSALIYPGMDEITLAGTFNNPNPGPVKVGTVTGVLGTLPAGCVAADFTVAGSAPVNAEIPAGNAKGAWSGVTFKMNNTDANQNGCKLATIPIVYTVTAGS